MAALFSKNHRNNPPNGREVPGNAQKTERNNYLKINNSHTLKHD